MRRILVTGGCGFIGSNFIRYMLGTYDDIHITNLDALTYAAHPNISQDMTSDRYTFIHDDIRDARHHRVGEIDTIFNFAAESHVDRSIQNPTIFAETNYIGTQVLLDFARKLNVRRFIQISTDEVYGSTTIEKPFTEKSLLAPGNPYSASKAAADLLVLSYINTYKIPAIITRSSNNYGPQQYPEKFIPVCITRLMRNQSVPIYGDGLHTRDWIFVRDNCKAIDAAWQHGDPGDIFNIAGEDHVTNLNMLSVIIGLMKKPQGMVEHIEDRKGHDRCYAIDCSFLKEKTGWRKETSIFDGLKETIAWYTNQCASSN